MSSHSEREERILAFWNKEKIFQKSVDKPAPKGDFTFYDGPPFANGVPHYGHILAGTMKDVIPRFKTMQGYRVARRWGWDCHGLPVENLVEKELNLKSKKDIVDYGIGKFNAAARESVMRYADEWRKIVPRLGRWVDMDNDYRTMDATYTESVWWIFKTLHEKGLIYEGFKSMNLCPRCETTLSNFEVAQGYKDITDISVYAKFKLSKEAKKQISNNSTESETYLIAWTTTAWTLPGNVALAVSPKIDYVKVKITGGENIANQAVSAGDLYIVAKARLEAALKGKQYEIVETFAGATLVGQSYEPLFDYYAKDSALKNRENGWKIYAADFVTTEDGTGIVHIAPAFGADDYALLQKENLPFVQHVNIDGTFKKEVTDFAGQQVKPKSTEEDKNAHQKSDIEVIKWLAHNGKLFEKEKFIHSYPHCWRCDTPLLNYATSSWFVKVTDIKDKLVKENNGIKWVPPEIGEGRFGNWLEGARDWAISRSRFWGAPIPVWRDGKNLHVIGSVDDLKKYSKAKNTYYVMRHGESENNVKGLVNSDLNNNIYHLTEKGKGQVKATGEALKKIGFDLVFASPFMRTKESATIIAEQLGLQKDRLIVDNRLHELKSAKEDEDRKVDDLDEKIPIENRFEDSKNGQENYSQVIKRMGEFLYECEAKYSGRKILIVTHGTPAMMAMALAQGWDREKTILNEKTAYLDNAEYRSLNFAPLPHNAEYELDLHRPFIDEIDLRTAEGNKLTRVPDVFDCWFESGSMPIASNHYPFENTEKFEPKSGFFKRAKGYPADFIAEGQDQTRGWFYSMLVLGVALFNKTPYKKVLVNGLVLAEDGEKMSKRKQNYPDPMMLVEKYGADSLRYYLMSSPVVHAQDLCFSEKGVDEVSKKIINRLLNVVSFYEMYVDKEKEISKKQEGKAGAESNNILDRWIISRLNETIAAVTLGLEAGELDRGARPIDDLIDDLSTCYLRRSRDRFKGDDQFEKQAALATTKTVLIETAKLLAPYMPFVAEDIYRRTNGPSASVHLETWPSAALPEKALLETMKQVRKLASQGLEARMSTKINVRQPLQSLKVKAAVLAPNTKTAPVDLNALLEVIKDEVNVKEVIFGASQETEVILDTNISSALKEEGNVRELIRVIQDLRKENNLTVNDKAALKLEVTDEVRKLIEKNKDLISRTTSLKNIEWGTVAGEIKKAGDLEIKIELKK